MVKIRYKQTALIFLILGFLLSFSIFAKASNLSIENVKVTVDGKSESGIVDVKPESDVKFKVKVKNLFTKDIGDLKIEGITVTATIFDIDDGDDIEEESTDFDLRTDDDKTVTVSFKIPLEVEADTYNVEIRAEGEDENGTDQVAIEELKIEVNKERHDVIIRKASLSTTSIKCSRSTQLSLNFMNLGEDEEDVELTVTNDVIGLNRQISFTITEDPFESDSKYSTTVPITVSESVLPDIYPILVKIDYANGGESKETIVDLSVEECIKTPPPETTTTIPPPITNDESNDENVDTIITPPVVTPPVDEPPIEETPEESNSYSGFISNNLPIILFIGVDILVVIVAVVLIVSWARKK